MKLLQHYITNLCVRFFYVYYIQTYNYKETF